MLIMLMIKSKKHTASCEQGVAITLKQMLCDKFVQLREFDESDVQQS